MLRYNQLYFRAVLFVNNVVKYQSTARIRPQLKSNWIFFDRRERRGHRGRENRERFLFKMSKLCELIRLCALSQKLH